MSEAFNPFTLRGKTILITGASSGIGRQCAVDCSRMGAKIVLVGRNGANLNETLNMMEGSGHLISEQDITAIPRDFVKGIVNEIGQLDGFIHSAGIEKTAPAKFLKSNDYMTLFETNAVSAFEIVRQLISSKNLHDGGSIVLISSISSLIARSGLTAYAASKGAITSAVRVMAVELAHRGIRVNAISPGTILTPMMEKALSALTEEQQDKRKNSFPLGLGVTTDISNTCIYLLSNASRWVTGQNLIVDGGFTIQ